jgi:hypothetical protein
MSDPSAIRFLCQAKQTVVGGEEAIVTDSSPFIEYRQGGEELPKVARAFIEMTAAEQGDYDFETGHLAVEFLRFLIQRHQESRQLVPLEALAQLSPEAQAVFLSPASHGLRLTADERGLDAEIYEVHVSDVEPKGVTLFRLDVDEEGNYERVEWLE